MTEHEHDQLHGGGAAQPEQPPAADELEAGATPRLAETVEENVATVREGIAHHGDAFLAYLVLDGVEQRSRDLLEQFERRYAGYFPDRETFTYWAIERTGLESALYELQREQGMWEGDLVWNVDAMWSRMSERYAVTERLGGVYAFRR